MSEAELVITHILAIVDLVKADDEEASRALLNLVRPDEWDRIVALYRGAKKPT